MDFDQLSWTDNAPSGLIGNWTDWHYGAEDKFTCLIEVGRLLRCLNRRYLLGAGCKLDWIDPGINLTAAERAEEHNGWIDTGGWLAGDIHPNRGRDCVDDLNRQLLQVLLFVFLRVRVQAVSLWIQLVLTRSVYILSLNSGICAMHEFESFFPQMIFNLVCNQREKTRRRPSS